MTTGTSPKPDTQPTAPARKAGGGRRSSTPTATATGRPTRRLVIVESPTKAKKIAPTSATTTSSSRRSATSATCRAAPPTSRPSTRASRGPASAWTSTTSSSRSTSSRRRRRARSPSSATRSRASTSSARHGPRPRGRGHRLAPARHAQAEGAGPPDGLPRDHRARDPRRRREPARPRPGPGRRPGDPPHPRPPLRLRGLPRAVEEGHAEAVGGPGAVGGHADHRAARARADGVRRRRLLGHRRDAGRRAPTRRRAPSAPGSSPSTATGSPPAATSVPTGSCAAPATAARVLDEGGARRLAEALHGRDLAVTSVESKPYTRKPYAPFMTSTLQQEAAASCASPPSARCARPSGCTRTATSPTCVPTRRRCPSRRSTPPARRPASSTATPTSPRPRGSTPARSRTRRRRTRRSGPSGETFRTPGQVAREVDGDEFRLYELIWQRTIASQMADARGTTVSVRITGTAGTGEECVVRRVRAHHHVPRVPQGLRRDRRRRGRRRGGRRRVAPAGADRGPGAHRRRAAARRPHHQPARPLHRGQPGQGARGAGHRPPVDLRVDHQDDPGPRVRLEEGQRAGAVLDRLRGDRAAGAPLRPAGRLRLHRRDGGRARRDRRGHGLAHRLAQRLLLRRRAGQRGLGGAGRRAEEAGRA